ncbi:PilZ domain-containing protein [Vibrio algarum]|uniref:Cyclic diguanosine monophosphate-binding protein n=1 Tax=Vibrio algarum TaxID=3020714 RepID=A0ABT4YTE9_9VIBR|nr:PilZ domain-containing protein [Vibrio sp. KJ40-1]MDB1124803.1 PilZ domain-containing protein [Vibrio sp. KJ40-1]
MDERRRFSRIIYNAPAEIHQGPLKVSCSIVDLSLHGLLLSSIAAPIDVSVPIDLFFHLPESDIIISLQAHVIELTENYTRVSIEHIDIDSISHLKRLVELNVGDEQLLHREIEQLSDLGAHS